MGRERRCLLEAPNEKENAPAEIRARAFFAFRSRSGALELVPEELIVNLVVELNLWPLHDRAQQPGAAVGGSLLQVAVAALHVVAEQRRHPL